MTRLLLVRATAGVALNDETLAAYCEYHGLDPAQRRDIATHVRSTLEQIGLMGLDEQLHEGRQALAHRAAGGSDETFTLNRWRSE